MNKNSHRPTKIGILGGGQLGRMLAEACVRLKIPCQVLADSKSAPIAATPIPYQIGELSPKPSPEILKFLSPCTHLIFENEFIDWKSLHEHLVQLPSSPICVPSPSVMERLQDKLEQKHAFQSVRFKTADFYELKDPEQATLQTLNQSVLKWSRFGYDGKGTWISSPEKTQKDLNVFIQAGLKKDVRFYVEKKISFNRELAMVFTQSRSGSFVSYPLVISEQVDGICKKTLGPASAFGIPQLLEESAHHMGKTLAKTFGLEGTFAIEFFETNGELLINEIAPRVHNSGHYSLHACDVSQFENHIRATVAEPTRDILPPHPAPAFCMLNLIGPTHTTERQSLRPPTPHNEIDLYWYDKSLLKAGRKMGHYSGRADSPKDAQKLLQYFEELETQWIRSLTTGTLPL